MNPNKNSAVEFLQMVIAGDIDAAYEKYVDMQGTHHNVHTPAGFEALRTGMKEAHLQFPQKQFTIEQVLGDENLVAVHSHLLLTKDGPDLAVVHLFRFDEGKIVELWDVAQANPEVS